MTTYIFFRADGWYFLECAGDHEIPRHVELNPETIRVEDAKTGEEIWAD